ncbi:hypothetical protein SARC_00026 [Sphaeroforma arctica JP610]|uniref:BHLH domain-containing protein n=1 Tax=Sphaeroforma arctica JP610 TaxID=667725 RepID=A0A0L0GG92_9EUKA|nr:hypothetical protein SARC_00026 [Sphaeroforma arctica JP610]KNC87894.1 hypothetical protein SARC_00026 [Sphaeroforma arctica JP610]|eukprot:XP_014161796.1 hypothetical protein SARC_00026 [Sphaeroforma arctica JP610]
MNDKGRAGMPSGGSEVKLKTEPVVTTGWGDASRDGDSKGVGEVDKKSDIGSAMGADFGDRYRVGEGGGTGNVDYKQENNSDVKEERQVPPLPPSQPLKTRNDRREHLHAYQSQSQLMQALAGEQARIEQTSLKAQPSSQAQRHERGDSAAHSPSQYMSQRLSPILSQAPNRLLAPRPAAAVARGNGTLLEEASGKQVKPPQTQTYDQRIQEQQERAHQLEQQQRMLEAIHEHEASTTTERSPSPRVGSIRDIKGADRGQWPQRQDASPSIRAQQSPSGTQQARAQRGADGGAWNGSGPMKFREHDTEAASSAPQDRVYRFDQRPDREVGRSLGDSLKDQFGEGMKARSVTYSPRLSVRDELLVTHRSKSQQDTLKPYGSGAGSDAELPTVASPANGSLRRGANECASVSPSMGMGLEVPLKWQRNPSTQSENLGMARSPQYSARAGMTPTIQGGEAKHDAAQPHSQYHREQRVNVSLTRPRSADVLTHGMDMHAGRETKRVRLDEMRPMVSSRSQPRLPQVQAQAQAQAELETQAHLRRQPQGLTREQAMHTRDQGMYSRAQLQQRTQSPQMQSQPTRDAEAQGQRQLERGEAYLHKSAPSRSVGDDQHGLDWNDEGAGGIGAMRSMAQQAGQKSPQYQSLRSQRTLESIPHQRRDTAERAYAERLQGNVTGGLRERGREGDREIYRGHRGEDDYDRKYYQASGGLSNREYRYERELERARELEREREIGREREREWEREWERYRGRDKEESDLREWHKGASTGRDMKRREDRRRDMELDGFREITYRDYLDRTGENLGQFLPGLSREDGPWFNDRPLVANQRYMVEGTYKRSTMPTDRGYDYMHKRGDIDGSVDPKKAISESPYDYREVYTDSKDGLVDERERARAMSRGAFDPMGDARQRDMHESRAFRTQAESERDLRMLEDRRREADRDGMDRLPSRTRPSEWTRADPRDRSRFEVEAEADSARKLRHSPYLENGRTSGGRDVGGDYLESIADQNTASARDPRSDREAGDWPAGVDRESSLSRARSQPGIAQRSRASHVSAVPPKARKEQSPSARARHLSNAQVRGQGHEQPSVSQSHLGVVGTNAHLGVSSTKGSLLLSSGTAGSLVAGPYYTRERKYSIVSDSHNNADSKQGSGRVRRNSMHTTGSGGSPGGSDVEPVDATPAEKENWRKMKHKKQERKRRDMHNDSFRKLGTLLPSKDDINLPKVQVLTEAITHIHELRRIGSALENVRATTAEQTRELQYCLRSLLRDRQRRGLSVPSIDPALLDVPPLAFNRPVGSREGMRSRSVTDYEHAERQQTARGSGRDEGYKESLRDRDADADADGERDQDGGRYMDRDKHTEDTPIDAEKHASADAYDNADGSGEDDDEGDPGVGVHTVKEFVVKIKGGSGSEWLSFSSMHKSATNPKGSLLATTTNSNDNNSNSNNNNNNNSSHNTGGHGSGDLDPSSSSRAFDAPYGGTNKHGREDWLSNGGQKRPTGHKRKPSSLSTSDAYSSAFAQPTPGMRSVSGGRPYTAPNRGQQVPTSTQTVGDNSTYSRGLESFSHQARAQRGMSKQMGSQRAYSPAREASSRTWSPMRERDSGGRQSGTQLKGAADRGDGSAKMRLLRLHVSVSEAQEMDVDEVVGEGKAGGLRDRYGGTRSTDDSRLEGSAMRADEAGAMRRCGSTKYYSDQQENPYGYDDDVEHYGRDKRHIAYEAEQYYVDEFGFEYEPEDLEASDIEYDEIEDALAAQLQMGDRGRYRERYGDTDMVQGDKSVGGYTESTGILSHASRPPTDEHGNASVNPRSELQGNKSAGGHGNNKHSQMPNPRSKGKNSVGRNSVGTISITPNPPPRNRSRASTSSAAKRKTPKSRSNARRNSESAGGIHSDAYDGYHGNEDGGASGAEGTYGRGGRPGHNENERRRRSQMNQAFNELQLRLPVFRAMSKPSKAHILDEAKKCLVNLKSTRAKLKGQISDLQYSIEDKRRRLEALRSR